jgi:hypothetical protein
MWWIPGDDYLNDEASTPAAAGASRSMLEQESRTIMQVVPMLEVVRDDSSW